MADSLPEIDYNDRAAEQLEDLETESAQRIVSKLDDVVWDPEHYLKRLSESGPADYRLRVGDYRVLVDWRREEACCSSPRSATGGTSTIEARYETSKSVVEP
ncbi:hypothetical protein BRC68_10810 [Halobacteriales archaeon QH_6_64_20]|nr:MAG: hypothetical protein BRC68_10810 [Halobacteriales archaeon QH_6_64_20]